MKKSYADFDAFGADDRRGVFLREAQKRGILPLNVEKDYWVCRVLGPVMKQLEGDPGRVFKGGTSLSKGFGIIDRFSEDIDIVLVRDDLIRETGDDAVDAAAKLSERQRRERFSKLRKAARPFLHDVLAPRLSAQLPPTCSVRVSDKDKLGMTLLVGYVSLFASGQVPYNEPLVKIEANIKAADFPTVRKFVSPYISDVLPREDWNLTLRNVTIISPERTFWEKVLAIHARHCRYRDQGQGVFDAKKVSRHFYDLAKLLQCPEGRRALKNLQLLADSREHDRIAYYDEPWRCPEEAKPGTVLIMPPDEILPQLQADFDAMQGMVTGERVAFDWVMLQIKKIGNSLNGDFFPTPLSQGNTVRAKERSLSKATRSGASLKSKQPQGTK
jgi:hypothetical protein